MMIKTDIGEMDLKERLIGNTKRLLENNQNSNYNLLIDYNRKLFKECYDLDVFLFIPQELVKEYCTLNNRCEKYIL